MAKILVIDDEDLVRMTLRQVLQKAGHEVVEARNGVEGVRKFQESPADLVITDVIMPEKEGIEVIVDLLRDHPGLTIIAISGGGRVGATDYLEIAKKFGAKHIIGKPFDRREVLQVVESSLAAAA